MCLLSFGCSTYPATTLLTPKLLLLNQQAFQLTMTDWLEKSEWFYSQIGSQFEIQESLLEFRNYFLSDCKPFELF